MDLEINVFDEFEDELGELKAMSQPHEDELDEFKENSASHGLNTFMWMKMNSKISRMNSASQLKNVLMLC